MKTLISQQEVAELAFSDSGYFDHSIISDTSIIAAQQKFIKPVLNGLYEKLEEGYYSELLHLYIKPALAIYVKLLMLPKMASNAGTLGVVNWKGSNYSPADRKSLLALKKTIRTEAATLMNVAVDYIESNPKIFIEYLPHKNVLNRVSIASDIVL